MCIDKEIADILSTARQTGENTYTVPKLRVLQLKLQKGDRLIHYVRKLTTKRKGNTIRMQNMKLEKDRQKELKNG